MHQLGRRHPNFFFPRSVKPPGHTSSSNTTVHGGRIAEYAAYGGIFLICALFLPDVFDGTFLKPLILYAMCAAIVTVWGGRLILLKAPYPRITLIHILFSLYLLARALSLFFAANLRLGVESVLQEVCYFIIFGYAFEFLGLRRTTGALLIVAAAASCVALAHFILPESSALHDFAAQLSTLSTFGNQSYFAGFLLLILSLLAAELSYRQSTGGNLLLPAILVAATLYLLVVTGSRSAWAASVAGIVLFMALTLKKKKTLVKSTIAVFAVVAGIYFLFRPTIEARIDALFAGGPQSSVVRRLPFYEGALNAFTASPVLGNGAGNFIVFLPRFRPSDYWIVRSEDIAAHAHNEFLEVLSETGILGLAAYLLLLGAIMAALYRRRRESGETGGIFVAGVIAAFTAVLIDGLSSMNLRTIPLTASMWMLLGAALGSGIPGARDAPRGERAAPLPFRIAAGVALVAEVVFFAMAGRDRYAVQSRFLDGFLLHTQSQTKEASRSFEDVLALDPHHADARFYLAADLLQDGDAASAEKNVRVLLTEYPYYPKAGTIGALALLELRDSSAAMRTIDDELRRNTSPLSLYYAATIAHRVGRDEDELRFLTELLNANIRSGMKDFGGEALTMLLEAPIPQTRGEEVTTLLNSYREKFSDDSTLVSGVDANIRRNASLNK
jgi:O-antigen ligase